MAKWSTLKKNLPSNWAIEVAKRLANKGMEVNAQWVQDVKRNKIKNLTSQEAVWTEINALAIENKVKKQSVRKMTAA